MPNPATRGDWFWLPAPRPDAAVRLYCFPHAGGDAPAFAGLAHELPGEVEVWALRMPGRAGRAHHPPPPTFDALLDSVTHAVASSLDRPWAVLGQSIGGLLAYETARTLAPVSAPLACTVLGFAAPHTLDTPGGTTAADADELIEFLLGDDDHAAAVLRHPVLREHARRVLRSDLGLLDTYRHRTEPVYAHPLHVVRGTGDTSMSRQDAEAWRELCTGPVTTTELPAGHLVLQSGEAAVRAVARDTTGLLTARR
ncbi:thioesterase II family protein [Amycolatopsis sp. WQ 127309]|uniref:thioesterase II family protein n=1 Tax=Amycolatopsis sp. WQ 127309 TaxID=2932773 RepID=UPI001FF54FB7|nr:alpha/beta fold hydrolase [Amycolatopsis sp. WQ 127309]UOZ05567.1 thioesterase domain-containing protein [Amycolatopsis sp. WQ 127309]